MFEDWLPPLSLSICLCMWCAEVHVQVCRSVGICVVWMYVHVRVCVWRFEAEVRIFFNFSSTLFWGRVFQLRPQSSLTSLVWLASLLQGLTRFHLPSLELQVCRHTRLAFYVVSRVQTQVFLLEQQMAEPSPQPQDWLLKVFLSTKPSHWFPKFQSS